MNLAYIKVLNLYSDISVHFIDIDVSVTGEQALLIKLWLINVSELDILIHELGNLVGFIDIPLDVLHFLMEEFNLLVWLDLVFVLLLELIHSLLLPLLLLLHLLSDHFKLNLLLSHFLSDSISFFLMLVLFLIELGIFLLLLESLLLFFNFDPFGFVERLFKKLIFSFKLVFKFLTILSLLS